MIKKFKQRHKRNQTWWLISIKLICIENCLENLWSILMGVSVWMLSRQASLVWKRATPSSMLAPWGRIRYKGGTSWIQRYSLLLLPGHDCSVLPQPPSLKGLPTLKLQAKINTFLLHWNFRYFIIAIKNSDWHAPKVNYVVVTFLLTWQNPCLRQIMEERAHLGFWVQRFRA